MFARVRSVLTRLLHEPLLLFALLGALLYALSAQLSTPPSRVVHIDAGEIARLRAFWETQARRAPSAQELASLVDERVDEEVLYREALRLGLERDDVIVRRRLAQKLAFLNEDAVAAAEPTPSELQAYFARHRSRYAVPETLTFQHVYFSPDVRGGAIDAVARAALHELQSQGGTVVAAPMGDPFMLPLSYADIGIADIERDYGSTFARELTTLPVGGWQGPLVSALGMHLVRVIARSGARVPDYTTVADAVRADFIAARRRTAHEAWVAGLRRDYRIEVEGFGAPAS